MSGDDLYEPDEFEEVDADKKSRKLPLRWTRVFKISRDPLFEVKTYELE
jgi:hypothetical protein